MKIQLIDIIGIKFSNEKDGLGEALVGGQYLGVTLIISFSFL